MNTLNFLAINAAANTGTVLSAAIAAQFITSMTVQAFFTDGAAAGSLKLQGSNDDTNPTHWSDVPNTATAVAAGATTATPVTLCCYEWVRVVFVSSGGAGTLSARFKSLGAS